MSNIISLPYGSQSISLNFRSDRTIYEVDDPVRQISPAGFRNKLSSFLSTADLDLACPAVVVSDKTRLCDYPRYLPVLLDTLVAHGADPEAIVLYIAYGTHRPQNDAASLRAYGRVFDDYRWIHHRCEAATFIRMGMTNRETPVHIRADIIDASCLITFGAISHHYFAGYGGGRKLIFPGLGKRADIYTNHGLFLDRADRCLIPECRPGQIADNPLAEDLADYETYLSTDLAIHGILDSNGRVCDLLVGKGPDHFRRACAYHAANCEVVADDKYDLVVAACGGYPKDINLIQGHKAIHNASAFVRDGGRLIVLTECGDGIGSGTFLPWFEMGGWNAAFDKLAEHYMGNGGTALSLMAKAMRIKISLVTTLSPELGDVIGIELISLGQVQAYLNHHTGSVAVIPNASMVVRKD